MKKTLIIIISIVVIIAIIITTIFVAKKIKKNSDIALNKEIVNTINNNSNLPVEYMRVFSKNDSNLVEYNEFINFMSREYSNRDIEFNYYAYPNDEADYHLAYISLLTNKYNLLGVTIGDDMEQSISKIESYGFTLKENNDYFSATLIYEDFTITIKSDIENDDETQDTVGQISISAKTEYLGNRVY